jgi:predicted ATPase
MITSLHLENFKAFSNLDMSFSNLNVFAGINGIGKSSVIQSLLLLRQSSTKSGSPGTNGIYIKGDLIDLGTGKDILHSQAENEIIKFQVEFGNAETFICSCVYDPNENFLPFKDQSVRWDLTQSLFSNDFQYLGAQRAEPAFSYPMDLYKVDKLKSLGKYGEYTAHFIAQNKRKEVKLADLLQREEKTNYLLNQIIAWLNEISPGVTLDSTLYPELNLAKVVYSFSDDSGYSPDYSPVNVGFGYSYVLPVLTAILSAEKNSLLIIENPESHLHPRGQALLGLLLSFAAKSGIQLFIETHSDHVINGIRIGIKKHSVSKDKIKIFFFDREDGESNTEIFYPQIDQNGRLGNLPKGFLDEYSNQLDQLIM